MNQDTWDLFRKFYEIRKLGWIKSMRRGYSGSGYTFERLLGKQEENFELPDYRSIEIKTKRLYTKGNISLFNATPDSYLFLIKDIQSQYGYPDKDMPKVKIFNGNVYGNDYNRIGINYSFKLEVDRNQEKVILKIKDRYLNEINSNISWSFQLLKEKLERKLTHLAIVKTDTKIIDSIEYFRYCYIDFYELKDFDTFILLIEKGIIRVVFKIGTFKKGIRKGNIHDHGTSFEINIENVEELYKKISFRNKKDLQQ